MYYKLDHKNDYHKNLLSISWFLGNTCNFSCSYCPENLHDGSIKWPQKIDIIKFIEQIKDKNSEKIVHVSFIGGEVTLWKDLIDLCNVLTQRNVLVSFHSNGSRTVEWWKRIKSYVHSINFSYHYGNINICHLINVINTLNDIKLHLNVMMLVDLFDECLLDANRIHKECDEINITLQPLTFDMKDKLYPYTEEQLSVIANTLYKPKKEIQNISHRGLMKKIYLNNEFEIVSASQLVTKKENSWTGWNCYAGLENLMIDSLGDIYRGYCKEGGKIGSIFEEYSNLEIPIKCGKDSCNCLFDILCKKEKAI